jgi:hypothetical protein
MLTILVRMKILTDALASVASVWIRAPACGTPHLIFFATDTLPLTEQTCFLALKE